MCIRQVEVLESWRREVRYQSLAVERLPDSGMVGSCTAQTSRSHSPARLVQHQPLFGSHLISWQSW